jgi:hypothetical protein
LNITKIAATGILTSTAASAALAGAPIVLGVSMGTTLGSVLGSAMVGVDFLLGNGALLGVTVASLLLAIVIARRKLGR